MEPKRLFDFIDYQLNHHPLQEAYGGKKDGNWFFWSTAETKAMAEKAAGGLLALGVQPGDKIATVVYKNRPEWVVTDLAIQYVGAINVPVYPTISPAEYEYIFNDSKVKYCFAGTGDLYDKVSKAQENVPSLLKIFTYDRQAGRPYWEDMFSDQGKEEIEARKANIQPEDMATIIYTSGTTGHPKGVMLSHNNIVSNVLAVRSIMPMASGDTVLSFLPLCHIFERTALYAYTYMPVRVVFTGTDNLGGDEGDLKAIRPHFFTTVPRLLEKVYEKIYNKGLELTGIKRRLFFWALHLTESYEFDKQFTGLARIKRNIADKLIFSKWRVALGGNVKGIISGAAACPEKILRTFSAAGIPVREGYGLTETSPGLAIGQFNKGFAKLGTIGPALPKIDLMIDASDGNYREGEGEILAKGPNIMMGYYNKPEATAAVMKTINGEQWFCTGDVGKLVKMPDGTEFLKITDRKKELLKTSGGKYVAPAPIESKLKEDFMIEQVMVIGEQQKFVSALIIPAEEALRDWCKNNAVEWNGLDGVVGHSKVKTKYQEIIASYNPNFSHIEQIKKFELLPSTWEPSKLDGTEAELTPTLKLKRRVIMEKYRDVIDRIYAD
ncbi:MAG TPA: long-chain fatty acid--CoA ligase [Saprospiraceae bacterium]|nr:long-chain fatty acid--CoA ligase [Saprospiraceae bacterium]HMQ85085.1 long-chain fatty acid--CoA ligase [Saprospiraceae bacterium]